MIELYLVRHGETALNVSGVYYGWTDCSLSDRGIIQCEELAEILKDVPFDVVISSPLKRAIDSAAIISRQDVEAIITDPQLRELNFGEWEGLHFKEIQKTHKEHWDNWSSDWKNAAPPSGERFIDFYERVKKSLENILESYENKKILLVTHQGSMRIIASILMGLEEDGYWHFTFEQGRYCLFQIKDGFCTVKKINSGR